jgi:mono/diheme cytochrome c family protein/cytochrome bd-type quinol oxidase subunit 1
MNYPIWEGPAGGLLIACVAIVHVFVSHFAVGGGLFLVLTERKARRERDERLLAYVKRFSRFFVLLSLVLGAITGVGVWFTIGLVHPQATSSLVTTFVWAWAIEWTFFAVEIAAALVYYYGWDRLRVETHLAVGWIYFWTAWLSLVVINGILAFMLTPGAWTTTRNVWNGWLNPTLVPSVLVRTCGAIGLAGIYALLVAAWSHEPELKAKLARYAGLFWVLPMAIAMPLLLSWYFRAAERGGVRVGEVLGTGRDGVLALTRSVLTGSTLGQPITQRAAFITVAASLVTVLLVLAAATIRRGRFGRPLAATILVAGFVVVGGAEWTREGLRKPYVIGQFMFVNGVRLPPPPQAPGPPPDFTAAFGQDRFTVEEVTRAGVLRTANWTRLPQAAGMTAGPPATTREDAVARQSTQGAEVFRLLCSACHTIDGYNAIRPLARGRSAAAIGGIIDRLARPVDDTGRTTGWSDPKLRLAGWRGRHMPPFVGLADERAALAVYLALLGGASPSSIAREAGIAASVGARYFQERCAACHGGDAQWPVAPRVGGHSAKYFYDLLGRLPASNEIMPRFEGSDDDRRALAAYIVTLGAPASSQEGVR